MPHTPTQFFWKYPRVGGGGFVVFCIQMEDHCARRSLRRPWKLGLRMVEWSKPRMFCEQSLRKIKFKGSELFRNVSVHEFYRLKALITLEKLNTTEWSKKIRIVIRLSSLAKLRWSGTVNFHCMQMALWWACDLFSAMIEMTCHVNHFSDLWQWCNFSGFEALEFSCIYTRV